MLKIRRISPNQNRAAPIEIVLPKFDLAEKTPHTGLKARRVSGLSRQNTITERRRAQMVSVEQVKSSVKVTHAGVQLMAQSIKPIVYNKGGVSIIVPVGTVIKVDVSENIALIGDDHVDVSSDEYQPIGQ